MIKILEKAEYDMAYCPVAPNWINIGDNNIMIEGCLLYLIYRIGP